MNRVCTWRTRSMAPLLATLLLVITACGDGSAEYPIGDVDDHRLFVVTSTNVWGAVVSAVGGDSVRVRSIIDNAVLDPHSYQATAEDAADTQSAQVLAYNGGGYDEFFAQLAEQADDVPRVVAFDLSENADKSEHEHENEHENEHVWYDLPTVAAFAEELARQLGRIVPDQRQMFSDNAAAFTERLGELHREVEQIALRHAGTRVVATEPIAGYLFEQAQLVDRTPPAFSEAVENETDVPIMAQQQIIDLVSDQQVEVVVNNAQAGTSATDRVIDVARAAQVPVVEVTETLPDGQNDYVTWMDGQIKALAEALDES